MGGDVMGNTAVEIIFATLLAVNFCFAGASRIFHCIRLAALQGMLLSVMGYLLSHGGAEIAAISVTNFVVKGFLLPLMLKKAVISSGAQRELEPLAGYSVSLIAVAAVTAIAFAVCQKSAMLTALAMITMFTGLFLIIFRRKAITQVIGFLVFENGIAIFSSGMSVHYGPVVELGILLDVFVLVFIMGIAAFQINREFEHIDTDRLHELVEPESKFEEVKK